MGIFDCSLTKHSIDLTGHVFAGLRIFLGILPPKAPPVILMILNPVSRVTVKVTAEKKRLRLKLSLHRLSLSCKRTDHLGFSLFLQSSPLSESSLYNAIDGDDSDDGLCVAISSRFESIDGAQEPGRPELDYKSANGQGAYDPKRDGVAEPLRNAPILEQDNLSAPSLFTAEAMLNLARGRKGLSSCLAPDICILDPDGDLEQYLHARGELEEELNWGCFHTRLSIYHHQGRRHGIIGRAVGAAFSVLLAEQLFASGCKFLISLSSAGQIVDLGPPPYFVVIERALRDEGTSYHYLRPSRFVEADPHIVRQVLPALRRTGVALHLGASWTTDAPFRETEKTVAERRKEGVLTVEMESAGLYAYAVAQQKPILCLAQVTNRLNCAAGDFAKGIAEGAEAALELIGAAAAAWEDGQDTEPRLMAEGG